MERKDILTLSLEELREYVRQLEKKVFKEVPDTKFKKGDKVFAVICEHWMASNNYDYKNVTITRVLCSKRKGVRYAVQDELGWQFEKKEDELFTDEGAVKALVSERNELIAEHKALAKLRESLESEMYRYKLFPPKKYATEKTQKVYKEVAQMFLDVKVPRLASDVRQMESYYEELINKAVALDDFIRTATRYKREAADLIRQINDCNACITAWFGKGKCMPIPDFSEAQAKIKVEARKRIEEFL